MKWLNLQFIRFIDLTYYLVRSLLGGPNSFIVACSSESKFCQWHLSCFINTNYFEKSFWLSIFNTQCMTLISE